MAWIESHQSLRDHRKTKEFKRLLSIKTPQAIGHLHLLWWWALDNAPDGNLNGINPADLSEVAEWSGKPERFIEALKTAGFVDEDLHLHDWDDYAGKLITRRKANTERVREHRNALRNTNVTVTSPLRNGATVPNSTVPYSTQPNSTKEESKERDVVTSDKKSGSDSDILQPIKKDGEQSPELAAVVDAFGRCGGVVSSPMIAQELADAEREYGSQIIIAGFRRATRSGKSGVRLLAYCRPIWEDFKVNGIPENRHIKQKELIPGDEMAGLVENE
jgi:hypothetical protein